MQATLRQQAADSRANVGREKQKSALLMSMIIAERKNESETNQM